MNPSNRKAVVWLVDDEEPFRLVLEAALSESQEVECAKSLPDCETLIKELKKGDSPDVLLLDIHLPGMSGLEAIPKINELAPNTYIVMLTGSSTDETIVKALVSGADGYVLKSANTHQEVIIAVQEVMADGITMDPEVLKKVIKILSGKRKPSEDHGLTTREEEVCRLRLEGFTEKEIAEKLFIGFETVKTHLKHIHRKLNVRSKKALVGKVTKERLL